MRIKLCVVSLCVFCFCLAAEAQTLEEQEMILWTNLDESFQQHEKEIESLQTSIAALSTELELSNNVSMKQTEAFNNLERVYSSTISSQRILYADYQNLKADNLREQEKNRNLIKAVTVLGAVFILLFAVKILIRLLRNNPGTKAFISVIPDSIIRWLD